ncbi:protein kinase domain-containing protein [Myxococcus fulvus]|uniref:protein kinase domain-containing protein n=1 Tax=Myxococcus fulvus TaxID=33 RepID=UPI00200A72EF|nr:protein kinase [Myxococcus fulvus]MCK8498664.1 protein kinase [Myxococcus fulvus]
MACNHCAVEHPVGSVCPRAPSLEGQRHGPLVLGAALGSGALGTVYLAEHTPTGHRFAVKVMHPHLAAQPVVRSRFLMEGRALRSLKHRHVARVLDARIGPAGLPCLLMEHAEGEPFSKLPMPLAPAEVVLVLAQALCALEVAHAQGRVHGGLSADSLVLTWDSRGERRVKVLGFGSREVLTASLSREERACGMVVGSPAFLAPEQWAQDSVDGRTDIYALGVVGYLLATGRLPFGFGRVGALSPAAPNELNPRVPRALSDVLLRALSQGPGERFPDAVSFREALLDSQGIGRVRPAPPQRTRTSRGSISIFGHILPEDDATPLHRALREVAYEQVPTAELTPPKMESPRGLLVRLGLATDAELVPVRLGDVTVDGFFATWAGVLPPLASQLPVELTFKGRKVACDCDVVRHVTREEARAWNGESGLHVQFAGEAARELLAHALGLGSGPRALEAEPVPDAELARVLSRAAVVEKDPYALLGALPHEDFEAVRRRATSALRRLNLFRQRTLPLGQRQALEALLRRVEAAGRMLGDAVSRAGYDATRGNLAGVARCLDAGLADEQAEVMRGAFLAARPLAESRARALFTQGHSLEVRGQHDAALERYAEALALDPLNASWLRHYQVLRGQPRPEVPLSIESAGVEVTAH